MEIMKVVFVIIGTFVGAGLASGQEVQTFFFCYGIKGMIGIVISSMLIGIIINKVLQIVENNDIKNYNEFINYYIKNKKIKKYINSTINIFILISFYVMIAGFGAYLNQEFNLNSLIGSTIFAIICFIILKTNVKGIVKVNEILIPILILIITLIGIINLKYIDIKNINNYLIKDTSNNAWFIKGILYSSYNSILLIPILISIKKYIKKEKHIKYISIIVTAIISILLLSIYLLLINIDVDIKNLEMPAVYAISKIFPQIKSIYGITILIAIFTTAISLGISFLQNTAKTEKDFNIKCIIICISAVLFSQIGFSNLVNLLYPILGILGLIQIIQILLTKKIEKKTRN